MDMNEAIQFCKDDEEIPQNGWVFSDDDHALYWSNQRPSIQEGFWADNSRGFMSIHIGTYTGNQNWKGTLNSVS